MGRPRSADVPVTTGECPVHGVVEFRIHKIGRRADGQQKYRARCPQCHTEHETNRTKR